MKMTLHPVPLDAEPTCPRGDTHRVYRDIDRSDSSFDSEERREFADWPTKDEASGFCNECGFPMFFVYSDLVRPEPHKVDVAAAKETTGTDATVGLTTDDSENEEEPEPSFENTPEKWKLALVLLVVMFVALFILMFLILRSG